MRAASIAPFASLVDITIPIGAVTYNSTVSNLTEPLAVTISVLAHRGCDLVLIDWLDKVAEAGLIKGVKTGRYAF